MKKVLLIFDGQHFSHSAFDFTCQLNESQPILLVGIFLSSIDYANTMSYYIGMAGPLYVPLIDDDSDHLKANMELFASLCRKNNIEYRIHDHSSDPVISTLKKESRFSDVIVLSSNLFYSNLGAATQRTYIHDTAHDSECPILMIPELYLKPNGIILAYDGSKSSVFAIKQFAYIFPDFTSLDAMLVFASQDKNDLPDMDYVTEFASRHFSSLSILKLNFEPRKHFNTWLEGVGSSILVTGAYNRPLVSEAFRRSFIAEIIDLHKLPVFVAHP